MKPLRSVFPSSSHVRILRHGQADPQYWRDLWRFRELFYFLAWRDILVRYKQTVIGIAWALIRPLLTMMVFTLIFGKIAKLPTDGNVPYSVMVLAGVLPWAFFSTAMSEAANSLVNNSNLISKIYFPRLIIPASAVVTSLVDFVIIGGFLAMLMAWHEVVPDWRLIAVPLFTLLSCAAAVGAGLWLAALNVKYRDFRYVVPFIVQIGLFISPVGFSARTIPEEWQWVYALNPMVGVINGFRWALLRGEPPLDLRSVELSVAVIAVVLYGGVRYFRRTEKGFADVI